MRLTVLGNSGPYPAKGGACSGYLLQYEGVNIVFDLGSGSLANLISVFSAELDSIDAIILSHLHADHISDISVLRYAVFRPNSATGRDGRACVIPLYCPPEPRPEYETLRSYTQFDVRPVSDGQRLCVNGLSVNFAAMTHPYPVFAVSVTAADIGRKFVYTGDTSWNQDLVLFAENANLLLADANHVGQDRLAGKQLFHMTAEECGITAAEAGAERLLLTHFTPGADIGRRIAEARAGVQKVLGRSDAVHVEEARILTSYEV